MTGRDLRRTLDIHAIIARVYKDDRFHQSRFGDFRMFVVTAAWVVGIERPPKGERLPRVKDLLGLTEFRFKELIASDAPRYEPDWAAWGENTCVAPMIRRDGLCGQRGYESVHVTNPADGTWRRDWYCSRHRDVARRVSAEQRALREAGGIPEPLPNRGGLGPCYLRWNWQDWYQWAAGPTWTPPKVGICADNWPVMAKVVEQEPPTLAVLDGGGEASGDLDGPVLRVVRGES